MALVNLQVDLTRTANALERIAAALELLLDFQIHPTTVRLQRNPKTNEPKFPEPEDQVRVVTDEALWMREQNEEQENLAAQGLPSQNAE